MPTSHFHLSGSIQPSSGSKQRDRIVSHLYGVEGDLGGLLRAVEDDARAVLGAHVARIARCPEAQDVAEAAAVQEEHVQEH